MKSNPAIKFGFGLAACGALAFASLAVAGEKLEYNRDIRPILADNCFRCHGPDSASRKADLRLDRREGAVEAKAIIPGKGAESEVIKRILTADPDELMPPPASHKKLTDAQKKTLQRWVDEGAEYQAHWSFLTPVKPGVPAVKNGPWVKNPIDAFVLSKLEGMGIAPAPEADRRTLARRLSLDLTGLPPAPADVDAFVNDAAPNAYEKYVDKLLESQAWGEHRAKYWLDAARFADTHGIHFDNYREIWAYRDWVIGAFNRNLPFDQFTTEQLAGDLLPNPSLDQKIATGFNRCNITTNEGGVIPEEYLVLYTRDRTETTALVWMGLSAGCAVCHDHKFDPLSQREFYEMAAFFNNTTQGAMDGNIKDTPPVIQVLPPMERDRLSAVEKEIAAAKDAVESRRKDARELFNKWQATASVASLGPAATTDGLHLHAPLSDGQGKTTKVSVDAKSQDIALSTSANWQAGPNGQSIQAQGAVAEIPSAGDFEKDQSLTCSAWVKLPANDGAGAIAARMDNGKAYRGWDFWSQRRQIGTHIVNMWPDNALKVVSQTQVPANTWTHVTVTYDGSGKASGVKVYFNGVPQATAVEADKLSSTIKTEVPFKIGQRHTSEPLSGAGLQDLRIYKRALSQAEIEVLAKSSRLSDLLAKSAEKRSEAETNELYNWWLGTNDAEFKSRTEAVAKLEKEGAEIKARSTVAHVMNERKEEANAFILFRGEYDRRKDQVKAKTPAILPKFPDDLPKNRLGFAKWLLQPDQPLTARVTVNRFWQEVFGTGLVRSSNDFGVAGELPVNQELLDYLAVDFRESGWDVKRFFKQLVTSNAYRQSAAATQEKLEQDPQNRYLSRGPRFRMEAEMVRDNALAVSGLLVKKIGGPSVKPYQPAGVWEAVAMIGSNTRDYRRDSGESLYRRSLYTFWKRSAPPASMEIFNAGSRENCAVRRERTNTPLQALVTLNDEQFIEAARNLAQAALKEGGATDETKLGLISARLLSRPLKPAELAIVQQSLADLKAHYAGKADDAKALIAVGESKADASLDPVLLATWTMLCNELMNMDEVLNK